MLPKSDGTNPNSILRVVDFPEPLGPKRPNISPVPIDRLRLFTATISLYLFVTSFSSTAYGMDI